MDHVAIFFGVFTIYGIFSFYFDMQTFVRWVESKFRRK